MNRLFTTDCGRVIRQADDDGVRWVQVCVLAPDHAGPCEPSRWVTPDEAA